MSFGTYGEDERKFVSELQKALCLPKDTRWFELRVAVDEAVTVKCEYYPEGPGQLGALATLVRQYELRPALKETTPLGYRSKRFQIDEVGNPGDIQPPQPWPR